MRKARWNALATGLALLVLSAGLFGCVDDVGMIDRTQPNKVLKSQFQGVWYNIQTVIDIPATSAFTFIGETYTGGLSTAAKVIFDIQEDVLLVYPIVEFVEGAEKDYVVKRKIRNYWEMDEDGEIADKWVEVYTGQPMAAFAIEKHFDVQRQYSASTGDENNVVEENTSDRLWWQRKYVRVNWSKNKITDFGFVARSIDAQGVDYYVEDWEENNPDRPILTDDAIVVTNKMFAQPTSSSACEAIQGSAWAARYDCAGSVIKVRNAYKKVPLNADYIAQRYHVNERQDKFGYFLTERYGYDDEYGLTVEGKVSLIQRWNLWDKSRNVVFEFDGGEGEAHGPLATCLWDDDCEGVKTEDGLTEANHCWLDEWLVEGHCIRWEPIPVADRPVKPIIYHLSTVFPDELIAPAYLNNTEYTEVFQDGVAWAKFWDEKGMLHPKACDTDADCSESVELEYMLDDDVLAYSCDPSDAGACDRLGSGTMAVPSGWAPDGGAGVCNANTRECEWRFPCDDMNPCDLGQTCSGGYCTEGGEEVRQSGRIPGAVTLVVYEQGADLAVLEVHGEPAKPLSTDQTTVVRFVNVDESATQASLSYRSQNSTGGYAPLVSANYLTPNANDMVSGLRAGPVSPAEASITAADDGTDHYSLQVTAGGATKVRNYVEMLPGYSYLVAYSDGEIIVAGQARTTDRRFSGMRAIHAAPARGELDIAFNGSLRDGGRSRLAFRDASAYALGSDNDQRVTIVPAGESTAVSCYHQLGEGMCVGWKPELTEADYVRIEEIRSSLPDLFVVCTNVYSGEGAENCDPDGDGTMNYGDHSLLNDCRYTEVMEDGSLYNPCKDRVPEYDQAKIHGDARYNFLYWIPEDQASSPLGYGPSAGDAHTGEIFYGIAHVYGAPMETYGTYARDLIWLINGEDDEGNPFDKDTLISSQYVIDKIRQFQNSDDEYGSLTSALSLPDGFRPDSDEMRLTSKYSNLPQALRSVLQTETPARYHNPVMDDPTFAKQVMEFDVSLQKALRHDEMAIDRGVGRRRLDRIKGTYLEDLLVTTEVKWGMSDQLGLTSAEVDPDDMASLSPIAWANMDAVNREHDRILHLARNNYMVSDFMDETIVHIAMELGCDEAGEVETDDLWDPDLGSGKCLKGENLRWAFLGRMFGGTLLHEVGHTLGLRHNFSASNDVLNYFDEYYSIRERERVLCQSEDWCETTESCDMTTQCASDDDCGMGTVCGEHNYCVDQYGAVYGFCTKAQAFTTPCVDDSVCAGGVCVGNLCHRELVCDADNMCQEGNVCGGDGTCKDALGQTVMVVDEVVQEAPVLKFVPRAAPTAEEVANNRLEYQYSSLMDYGGSVTFDIQGLGKYDRMALIFGYTELTETWSDTSGFHDSIEAITSHYDGYEPREFGYFKDTTSWKWAGTTYSQFQNLNDRIGIENNLKRDLSPYMQVKIEQEKLTRDSLHDAYDVSWVEVPYKFCSDEYRGQMSQGGCYYFDTGADILEIIYHNVNKLEDYYVFDAFKRESYTRNKGGNGSGYFNRLVDRWLRALGDAGMYYGLYYDYFKLFNYTDVWRTSAMGGYPLDLASRWSLQVLADLITSPAPGTYELSDDGTEWLHVDYETTDNLGADQMNVPLGKGKFPYTKFWDDPEFGDAGYWRYEHALWLGSFWEKTAALMVLSENTANFMSDFVGEQLEVGVGSAVGFDTAYSTQMSDFFAGIIAGMPEYTDAYADPATRVMRSRGMFDVDGPVNDLPVIRNSLDNFSMKLYVAVYGLAYLPASFDPAFIDSLAVMIKGSQSEMELSDDVETVEFTDPFGHKTYIAQTTSYGEGRVDAAAHVVAQANEALEAYNAAEPDSAEQDDLGAVIKEYVVLLDTLRALNELYGDLTY